jgi:hypothetical protein
MTGEHTPCAVHTLIEDIESGAIFIKPYNHDLASLEAGRPPLDDPKHWVLAQVRRDGQAISTAHKFDFSSWPSRNTALSDVLLETGKDMLASRIARLPYPDVVFCRRWGDEQGVLEEAFLIRERRDATGAVFSLTAYSRASPSSLWLFYGFSAAYRYGQSGSEWTTDWIAEPSEAFPEFADGQCPDFDQMFTRGALSFFVSALAALSSKGPEIRTLPAPAKLNKQRAKKGRPPIFEYRIVEIPAWAKAKAEGLGGTHASPRLHWRRGHERRLGEDRKTFVHACLVGVAENGFIHKDYAVAPTPAD